MRHRLLYALLVFPVFFFCHCATPGGMTWDCHESNDAGARLQSLVAGVNAFMEREKGPLNTLLVTYPYDMTLFPPDMASPTVTWRDGDARSRFWLVRVAFDCGRKPLYAIVGEPCWTPDEKTWETIKANSTGTPVKLTVFGLADRASASVASVGSVCFKTSTDPVGDAVFFRQIPLPFAVASQSFEKTRWRMGHVGSYDPPVTVLQGVPVCASCHAFSADGRWISMEYNLGNDGGAQFIAPVNDNVVVKKEDFFSWSDFPRSGVLPPTRGLFGRMSPSGRFAAASVNEISFATVMDDLDFCQLFFPTYGVIGIYDRQTRKIRLLPGVDDYALVQANPVWSPDEKEIVFCRAKTRNEVHKDLSKVTTIAEKRSIHELNSLYPMRFDLYRVPFNSGSGGEAVPLEGASDNGASNYFARYSPDGRWIVFTKSPYGIMLQPDSELWIVPAAGGAARKMNCNRGNFNSWHSWSSNGRWLLFSSKANTPYTEVFLTHVDHNGNDTPPVVLSRFNEPGFAANVPEFAPAGAGEIQAIQVAAP
ncbi:MAG: TolB family protein [Thermodesulfobacteriota bacterium]